MLHKKRLTCVLLSMALVLSNVTTVFAAEPATLGESSSQASSSSSAPEKPKTPIQLHNPSRQGMRSAAFTFYADYPSVSGSKGVVAAFSESFTVREVRYSASGTDWATASDWSGYTKVDSYSLGGDTLPAVKITNPTDGNYLILVDPADGVPAEGFLALLKYSSADTEPPEILFTQMSFSSGSGTKTLSAVIGAKDASGLQSLQYATAPINNPTVFATPYTTISTGTTITVDYIDNGMILWAKATDTAGNTKEQPVLVVNPTTEGEKIVTPAVVSQKDASNKVTSVNVSFAYDPASYAAATGTTINFAKATGSGATEEVLVDSVSKTFPITANGDYTFLLDFPMTKTINVGGTPTNLTTTVHYRLKVPVTAIGTTEAPATPPTITSSVKAGTDTTPAEVTVSSSTADARIFYKWITSDQATTVGTTGFTASGSNKATVTAPSASTKAQVLVAYAEKNGLKSNITAQLIVDDSNMLEIGESPAATVWVKDTRALNIKTATSGTYANSYVVASKLHYANAPSYTFSEGGTNDADAVPSVNISANKQYSFGISHIARVDVTNPFDTSKVVEAATSYRVTKDYTESHIDMEAPVIPNIAEVTPDAAGTTVDLSVITDAASGIKTVGSFWDAKSEFVAPTGAWDSTKYPITPGNPTVGRFDKGQLVIYAEDNVGRFSYATVSVKGVGMPTVSISKTPDTWTNQDVTVEVVIAPATGDSIDNWTSNLGAIIKNPDGTGNYTEVFTANSEKDFILSGPAGITSTEKISVANIDKVAPTINSMVQTPDAATNQNVSVKVSFSDNVGGSGIKSAEASAGIKVISTDLAKGEMILEAESNITDVTITVKDNAGNTGTDKFSITTIDKSVPTMEVTPSTTDWTNQDVTLDVELTDTQAIGTLGVDSSLTGFIPGNLQTVNNPLTAVPNPDQQAGTAEFKATGNTPVKFTGLDKAGNKVEKSYTVDNIDKTKPVINITEASRTGTQVTLNIDCTDTISGIKTKEYALVADTNAGTIAGATWIPITASVVATYGPTSRYIVVNATDNAGNITQAVYSLYNFGQYVVTSLSPTTWVPNEVTATITIDWAQFKADSGVTDVTGVSMTPATGMTFGSVTNIGNTSTAEYTLDHNDTWTARIKDIPDGMGGTFDWAIPMDVKNIDTIAPGLSSTKAGHYDSANTFIIVTAQDVTSVAGLPYTDASGIKQAVIMPTGSVPIGKTYAGTLSGTPVTLDSKHRGVVSFSATDMGSYSLVAVDMAGNLSSTPLDTSRLNAGPIVDKEDNGWTRNDVAISVNTTNPKPATYKSAVTVDGVLNETLPVNIKATKNGVYDISAMFKYIQLDTQVVYPNNTTGHNELDADNSQVILPTLADASPFIPAHNIGGYDWKLPTTVTVSNIDKTPPTVTVTDNAKDGIASGEVTVTIKAVDPVTTPAVPDASGINTITYTIGSNPPVVVRTPQTMFVLTTNDPVNIVVEDDAGNITTTTYTAQLDSEAPKLTYVTNPTQDVYSATRTVVTMDVTDNISGIKSVVVPSDLKLMQAPSTADPLHHVYVYYSEKNGTYNITTTDVAGNTSTHPVIIRNIDNTPPTVTSTLNPAGVTYGSVTIMLDIFDTESGIRNVQMHDGTLKVPEDGKLTYIAPSNGNYIFTATDNAGNTTTKTVVVNNIKVEISRPQDSKFETVDQTNNTPTRIVTQWTSSKQTLSPEAYPSDQIDHYMYAVTKISREDESPKNPDWKTTRTRPSIKIDREGIFSVQIKAYNKAGTESALTEYIIMQDTTKPRISSEKITNSYVSFKAKDNLSGIDYIQCDCGNDGDSDGYIKCVKSDGKTHKYTIADLAGNKATETLKIGDTSSNSNRDDDDDDEDSSSSSGSSSSGAKVVGNTNTNTTAPKTSGKPSGAKNPPTGSR